MGDDLTIHALENLINQNEKSITLNDALTRLQANVDFIAVIDKGYLTDLALHLVKLKGQDSCVGLSAELVDRELTSIGRLSYYFDTIQRTALMAKQSTIEANSAIDEIEHTKRYS